MTPTTWIGPSHVESWFHSHGQTTDAKLEKTAHRTDAKRIIAIWTNGFHTDISSGPSGSGMTMMVLLLLAICNPKHLELLLRGSILSGSSTFFRFRSGNLGAELAVDFRPWSAMTSPGQEHGDVVASSQGG